MLQVPIDVLVEIEALTGGNCEKHEFMNTWVGTFYCCDASPLGSINIL